MFVTYFQGVLSLTFGEDPVKSSKGKETMYSSRPEIEVLLYGLVGLMVLMAMVLDIERIVLVRLAKGAFLQELNAGKLRFEWCIWNKLYVNCGYEIKWRMILAVVIAIFTIA